MIRTRGNIRASAPAATKTLIKTTTKTTTPTTRIARKTATASNRTTGKISSIENLYNYINSRNNQSSRSSISNNTSAKHLLKHLLQKLNSTTSFSSSPFSPLYDFLLGNFKLSNGKMSSSGSQQKANVSALTKRQLMTLQLNKTLMDMATDFVRKPPIANSFSFDGGALTFNGDGEDKRQGTGGIGGGYVPSINSTDATRIRNDTNDRFSIPLVSLDEDEVAANMSVDGETNTTVANGNLYETNKKTNDSLIDNSWVAQRSVSTNTSNVSKSRGQGEISGNSNWSQTTSTDSNASNINGNLTNTFENRTINVHNKSSSFTRSPTPYSKSNQRSNSPDRATTAAPSTTPTSTPSTTTTTPHHTSSPDYISEALHSVPDSQYLRNIRVRENCMRSRILYNVTLRGGYESGKFRDRGHMGSVDECARLCCQLNKCDLVMMLQDRCFSVHCKSPRLCESIPARSPIFSPTVCYVRHE